MLRKKDEKMVMELVQYYNKRTGSRLSGNMIVDSINVLLDKIPLSNLVVEDTWVAGDCYVDTNDNFKTSDDELNKVITNTDNQVANYLLFSIDYCIYGFSKMFQLMVMIYEEEEEGIEFEVFLNYCNYCGEDELIVFSACDMENGFDVDTNELNNFILEALTSKVRETKENLEDVEWAIKRIENIK